MAGGLFVFGKALAGIYECAEDIDIGLKGCAFRRTDCGDMFCSRGMVRGRIVPRMVLPVLFGTAEAVPFQSADKWDARQFAA